jgi:hypothetical protein
MNELERSLKGDDIYCTIIAYVVRGAGATVARGVPDVFGAGRVLPFELRDEAWPTSIDMTEFKTTAIPADFAERVASALKSVQQDGPTLCWFMFDGAFDAAGIGSEWHRLNCYAVYAPSLEEPVLALSEADRRSERWAQIWEQLSAQFYDEYPSLRAIDG